MANNTNEQANSSNQNQQQNTNQIKPLFEDMNTHGGVDFDTSSIEKMKQAYTKPNTDKQNQ